MTDNRERVMLGDHPNKEDMQFLQCLAMLVLTLFTGFFAGGNLEKNYTIGILKSQIEKLEAVVKDCDDLSEEIDEMQEAADE